MEYVNFDLEKLRLACRGRGYLLKDELEISHSTLSRWLNGRTKLSVIDLEEICEVLDRNPLEFFAKNDT